MNLIYIEQYHELVVTVISSSPLWFVSKFFDVYLTVNVNMNCRTQLKNKHMKSVLHEITDFNPTFLIVRWDQYSVRFQKQIFPMVEMKQYFYGLYFDCVCWIIIKISTHDDVDKNKLHLTKQHSKRLWWKYTLTIKIND